MWTILDENSLPVITFTSFLSLEGVSSAKVSDYPVEEGSFSTYNKTVAPRDFTVTLAVTGDDVELQEALSCVEALRASTQMVSVIAPYQEFKGYCLESYDFASKVQDGVGILIFSMQFKEVRETKAVYTNSIRYAKTPTAVSVKERGKVQTDTSILSNLSKKATGSGRIV